jgi:preprotein translocase subunit SecB
MRSIESPFQFLTYKIYELRLDSRIPLDGAEISPNKDVWQLKLNVQVPRYYVKQRVYIGGLKCELALFDKSVPKDEYVLNAAKLIVEAAISGVFAVKKGRFTKELEETLVKVQIPALLFPYVRGTVTSVLANAGFGSIVLPLLNMNQLAKKALKDSAIDIIED